MHIVDSKKFHEALKNKGFKTIGELALHLGIHRNTIHHYLSGHGVFPENLEKIFSTLDLKPQDILTKKIEKTEPVFEKIAPVVDALHKEFSDVTFVLFGSRTKGTAGKYSDWDVGVFTREGLSHEIYRNILKRKDELIEDFPYFVDVVNLDRADKEFLRDASKGWIFLTGRFGDWLDIQRKAAA